MFYKPHWGLVLCFWTLCGHFTVLKSSKTILLSTLSALLDQFRSQLETCPCSNSLGKWNCSLLTGCSAVVCLLLRFCGMLSLPNLPVPSKPIESPSLPRYLLCYFLFLFCFFLVFTFISSKCFWIVLESQNWRQGVPSATICFRGSKFFSFLNVNVKKN
jgi:hypothetical protein